MTRDASFWMISECRHKNFRICRRAHAGSGHDDDDDDGDGDGDDGDGDGDDDDDDDFTTGSWNGVTSQPWVS